MREVKQVKNVKKVVLLREKGALSTVSNGKSYKEYDCTTAAQVAGGNRLRCAAAQAPSLMNPTAPPTRPIGYAAAEAANCPVDDGCTFTLRRGSIMFSTIN